MRILLFIVFMGLGCLSSAQSQLKQQLKPSDMVAAHQRSGTSFQQIDLFEKINNASIKSAKERALYETLEIKTDQLSKVLATKPNQLTITLPYKDNKTVDLELVKIKVVSDDFQVKTSSGLTLSNDDLQNTAFYRGIVDGEESSIATFGFFDEEVVGMYSSPTLGNVALERKPGANTTYALVQDQDGTRLEEFYCDVEDFGDGYHISELTTSAANESAAKCTKIYFEVDYDIFQDKGGVAAAVSFVEGLFNEVATIYANDGIRIEISEIFVWDTPSPYQGGSSLDMLNTFQRERQGFNGDLAQLLSYKSSGGIAVVSGLCHPISAAKMSFASIDPSYTRFPNYSFTVLVVAHELGHLFGSMHTHACVWNGNNTAIDACAGFVEGSCSTDAGVPSQGGTIMSYCHLTSAGTNFSLGFGLQPGNLIRNRVANAACLAVCDEDEQTDQEDDNGQSQDESSTDTKDCADNQLSFTLKLDYYPMEVVWHLVDEQDQEWYSGGPYVKELAHQEINETFCLPAGRYYFIIEDYYGDGLCCQYGDGYYLIKDEAGKLVVSGSQYSNEKVTTFLLGEENPDPTSNACVAVNFNDYEISAYGGVQDQGDYQIKHRGKSIKLSNSAWKSIPITFNVNPNTILEFEFASTKEGDIHAIGLDSDAIPSSSRSFNVFGKQDWGILDFANYEGNSVWKTYQIPVGTYYSGQVDRLFFISDDDFGDPPGNSYFRNVKIFDGDGCAGLEVELPSSAGLQASDDYGYEEPLLKIAPNPAYDQVRFEFFTLHSGKANITLFNMNQAVLKTKEVNVTKGMNELHLALPTLPNGTYFTAIQSGDEEWIQKLEIAQQ